MKSLINQIKEDGELNLIILLLRSFYKNVFGMDITCLVQSDSLLKPIFNSRPKPNNKPWH